MTTHLSEPQRQLAAALGRIPSGLYILTARHNSVESGTLVSWVQQCGFTPPLLTLALKRERLLASWLTISAIFTLNILDDGQTDMIAHFGRGFGPNEDAFANLDVQRAETAAPVLSEALAFLECRVHARYSPGDHDLLVGEVLHGKVLNEGQPMIHVRKSGMHY